MIGILEGISPVYPEDFAQAVEVWEASVRATHHFLTEADIEFFKPLVAEALVQAANLACVRALEGQVVGFIGVNAENIEMLFVHPHWRAQGIGRRLLQHAVTALSAKTVDVNEQNDQAVGFYRRQGFAVVGRSERDGLGKPFPLLHLRLKTPA